MKHVSILIPDGQPVLTTLAGTHMILSWVNEVMNAQGLPPAYAIDLVGVKAKTELSAGLFTVRATKQLNEVKATDLVVIPAMGGDLPKLVQDNKAAIAWVQAMRAGGAEVGSFCTGAYFFAATGLVDGSSCTTHWSLAEVFRSAYPKTELLVERIIVEQDGLYSSGGAESFLNLVLYWIEKFNGRELALQAAKRFEIDIDRNSQAPFLVFQGMKNHSDASVLQAQRYMEAHFAEPLSMEAIAAELALSPRNFNRRFKEATHLTPLDYLQRVRIEVAKRQLESGSHVNEAMYASGYSDEKAFRGIFKRTTSMSPVAYRARYARGVMKVAA